MRLARTFGEEIWVRERVTFLIMVAVLIFLFAFTFAILGKGAYEPSGEENASASAFVVSA
jgi:succinate dehydrogenase hydrophobic anchor subunit